MEVYSGSKMVLVADFITAVAIMVEPQFNEPLFNKLLGIMNNIFWPGKSNSKMYGTEPRFNDLTNLYLTNSSV